MKKKQRSFSDYLYDYEGTLGLIPADLGVGIKWVHERDKHRYCTRLTEFNFQSGKRKIHLSLSSFVGISIGAMHSYAVLRAYSPECYNLTKKTGGHGGYVGVPKNHPRYYDIGRWFSLSVTRRLTKVEKDVSGELLGRVGSYTNRFNTENEAKAAAIATFKRRFGPGWVLLGDEDTILAET